MTSVDINSVNQEINRLTKLRQEHFDQQLAVSKEELLQLEWLKDVSLMFTEGLGAYGNTEYALQGIFPEKFRGLSCFNLAINGETSLFDNISLRCNFFNEIPGSFAIVSSNLKMLTEFIEKYVGDRKITSYMKFDEKIKLYQALQKKAK